MATTTAAAQRDLMVTTVKDLVPGVLAQKRFIPHDQRTAFREWAEANPQAATRRFSIRNLGPVTGLGVNDTTQVWVQEEFECVLGYANDFQYGEQMRLDQDDVMWRDLHLVKDTIGQRAFGTFGDAAVIEETESIEPGTAVSFAVLTMTLGYYRSTP